MTNKENVSLWINNDEGMYRLAQQYCRVSTRDIAAENMLDDLTAMGHFQTPDGVPYTKSSIKYAMIGM